MPDIQPPVIGRSMGRPPLDPQDPTVKTTLRFTKRLLARAAALVGERRVAAFIREAVEEKLEREEAVAPKPKTKPRAKPPSPSKD